MYLSHDFRKNQEKAHWFTPTSMTCHRSTKYPANKQTLSLRRSSTSRLTRKGRRNNISNVTFICGTPRQKSPQMSSTTSCWKESMGSFWCLIGKIETLSRKWKPFGPKLRNKGKNCTMSKWSWLATWEKKATLHPINKVIPFWRPVSEITYSPQHEGEWTHWVKTITSEHNVTTLLFKITTTWWTPGERTKFVRAFYLTRQRRTRTSHTM